MPKVHIGTVQGASEETIYDRFAEQICDYLLKQVHHQQDVEDLLLEVFLAAFSNATLE